MKPLLLRYNGALMIMLAAAQLAAAQNLRLPEIERSYDAVVLVADAHTGRMIGGARLGEAHEARYRPGSLFKLAIAIAALRSGKLERSFTYTCDGKDTIAGHVRRCWNHRGHATIGFSRAISLSCNLYFRTIAQELSTTEIAQAARSIGMAPSGADNAAAFERLNDETLLGDAFAVTPAQMLNVAVTLASRGRISPGGIDLFGATYRPLYDGLRECVKSGTGKGAWTPRFSVAGKTGTSEIAGSPQLTVGWFIGFAPATEPRYAIVVMHRRARGTEAAIVARKVLERLL